MAKLGFKDIIMKYLKKDEAFKVKYAMNPNQKIAVATYNDRADAEKFVSDIIKKVVRQFSHKRTHQQTQLVLPLQEQVMILLLLL